MAIKKIEITPIATENGNPSFKVHRVTKVAPVRARNRTFSQLFYSLYNSSTIGLLDNKRDRDKQDSFIPSDDYIIYKKHL